MPAKRHLVLLPGSLNDEAIWTGQAEALADIADCSIAHILGPDSLGEMAEAALAHAPERFALAGFSMGGRVALEMWRRAPERIERLALVSTSIHPIGAGEAEKRQPMLDLAMEQGMAELARLWFPRIVRKELHGDAALMGLLAAMAERQSPHDYVNEVRALLNRPDALAPARSVTCPTLILAGDEDTLSTPSRVQEVAAAIPHARTIMLEGCSHFPMLEKPADTTVALRAWLLED